MIACISLVYLRNSWPYTQVFVVKQLLECIWICCQMNLEINFLSFLHSCTSRESSLFAFQPSVSPILLLHLDTSNSSSQYSPTPQSLSVLTHLAGAFFSSTRFCIKPVEMVWVTNSPSPTGIEPPPEPSKGTNVYILGFHSE